MKYFLLLGGGCGFLLAFVSSALLAGNEMMIALWNGVLGCVLGMAMMWGLSSVLVMCIRNLAQERAKARLAASSAN